MYKRQVKDYNIYRASFFEFDAHFIHQRVERLLRKNDLTIRPEEVVNVERRLNQLELARNFSPVNNKSGTVTRKELAWQDISPIGHKAPKDHSKEAELPPTRTISLTFKARADAEILKTTDPFEDRNKTDEAAYQAMRSAQEVEIRQLLAPLLSMMRLDGNATTRNGFELSDKARASKLAAGDAQQEEFFNRLSKSLNLHVLSNVEIAGHPEVLRQDKDLVAFLEQEIPDVIERERQKALKRNLRSPEAETIALVKTIENIQKSLENNDGDMSAVQEAVYNATDRAMERGSHWIGLPVPAGSMLDQVGCDYLLVNKHTGEYYPLDVTVKGQNKAGRLVDCKAVNEKLTWEHPSVVGAKDGKVIPPDRSPWVMVVADEEAFRDAVHLKKQLTGADDLKAKNEVEVDAIKSVAVSVLATTQNPSGLNLYDNPLPSLPANPTKQDRFDQLDIFIKHLRAAGKVDWADDLDTRLRTYIKHNY